MRKNIQISIRIDDDLDQALDEEAKRRNQGKLDLMRTFLRDGLARYDAASDQILESQVKILHTLKLLQEMTGAALHYVVEQNVLKIPKGPNEHEDAYVDRLHELYRETVFTSLRKGGRIAAKAKEEAYIKVDRER